MKKKIKDLTYDQLSKWCQSIPQDYSTGECVGCPFWKFKSVDKNCTCSWLFNLWGEHKNLIEVLDQEIEVEDDE